MYSKKFCALVEYIGYCVFDSMAATLFVQPLDLVKNRMQLSGMWCSTSNTKQNVYLNNGMNCFHCLYPLITLKNCFGK